MDDAQAQQTNPLFGIIPKEFFTPLASPNRLVYWDCLCRLFQAMSAQLSFGIEREILVDELQFYFEQNQAAEFEEDDINGMDSRKKANEMLRLLEKYGWLEVETDKSYVQRVNFYDYAVKVMKTLLEISDGRKVEYQGYIYTIYSLVRTNTDHPAVVLQQIRDNTDMLITGLKNLNSNIKHYIDELTKHKTVAEIMNALFNDYITNIVDKAYHRLLTSDNVSKFRPEIIERLEANGHSSRYIAKTSEELAAIREIPVGQAEELVYQTLRALNVPSLSPKLVRVIYELKTLVYFGVYPNVFACTSCGSREQLWCFDEKSNGVMCRECQPGPVKYPLDEAALYTMQYIVTAPVEKLYTFTVTEEVLGQVTKLIQYYMRQYVEKELKTPVFLS